MEKVYSHSTKLMHNLSQKKSNNGPFNWSSARAHISLWKSTSIQDVNSGKYRIPQNIEICFVFWISKMIVGYFYVYNAPNCQMLLVEWCSTQQRNKGLFMLSGFSLHIFGISEGLHDISDKENVTYLQGRRVLMPKASCDLSHSVLRLPTTLRQSSELDWQRQTKRKFCNETLSALSLTQAFTDTQVLS